MTDDQEDHSGETAGDDQPASSQTFRIVKISIACLFLGGILFLFFRYDNQEILSALAAQESRAIEFKEAHPVGVYAVAFLIYVAATGFSLPGAAILTILYGWFFDFLPALVMISFASSIGATLAFLMSRYLLRDTIETRFGEKLETFNQALEKEGAWYLFTLRLIPAVPFFVLNLVMGLTPIKTRTFYWVSQLGMLPGTAVYTYAGNSFPEIATIQSIVAEHGVGGLLTNSGGEVNLWQLFIALVLLGLLPVVLKFAIGKLRPSTKQAVSEQSSAKND